MSNLSRTILKGWKVLVVDNEPDSIEIAATLLNAYGASVITAANGKVGFEKATTERPNFIISDISMPIMSGWDMVAKLKNQPITSDIPVIALTAHGMEGDRERAMAAGFHNHLTKPLDPIHFIRDLLQLMVDLPDIAQLLESDKAD
jgi:CheY-like chemotaxis protein